MIYYFLNYRVKWPWDGEIIGPCQSWDKEILMDPNGSIRKTHCRTFKFSKKTFHSSKKQFFYSENHDISISILKCENLATWAISGVHNTGGLRLLIRAHPRGSGLSPINRSASCPIQTSKFDPIIFTSSVNHFEK